MKQNKKNIHSHRFGLCFALFLLCALMIIPLKVYAQDVLCPEPASAAMTAPADLAQVQNDIDRLALCVERAKLLAELDRTLKDREKDANSADLKKLVPLSPTADDVSKIISQQTIAVKNMPSADVLSGVKNSFSETIVNEKALLSGWKIRRIWGGKGNTKAQLARSNGIVATVVQNDVLPDGSVVVSLSPLGVTLKKDGKAADLEWAEAEKE